MADQLHVRPGLRHKGHFPEPIDSRLKRPITGNKTNGRRKTRSIFDDRNPSIKMLAMDYERRGLHQWTNERVAALAAKMNMTVWLLCALVGAFELVYNSERKAMGLVLDNIHIRRAWRENCWPISWTLHFDMLEKSLNREVSRG